MTSNSSFIKTKYIKLSFSVSFVLSLLLVCVFFLSFDNAVGSDLVSYLTGALAVKDGQGKDLYNFSTQATYQAEVIKPLKEQSILPFLNSPLLAVFFIPLTFVSLLTAYKIFVIFSFIVLGITSYLLVKTFKNIPQNSFWVLLPFLFYPSLGAAFSGQITIFLLLLILTVFIYIKKGSGFIPGVLAPFLFLKIQYVILIPFLYIMTKDKKAFFKGLLATTGLIFLTSILVSGIDFFWNYPEYVLAMQRPEFGIRVTDMFTFYALSQQISFLSNISSNFLMILNFALYIIALYYFSKKIVKMPFDLAFSVSLLFVLVFAVHGVNYDLGLLLIPIFVLIDRLKAKNKAGKWDLISLFLLLTLSVFFPLNLSILVPIILILATLVIAFPLQKQVPIR